MLENIDNYIIKNVEYVNSPSGHIIAAQVTWLNPVSGKTNGRSYYDDEDIRQIGRIIQSQMNQIKKEQ